MPLLIVSGRSGSGKTITLNVLEDLGYYCIDNIPVEMVPELVEKLKEEHPHLAISIDARNFPKDISQLKTTIDELYKSQPGLQIIYLDASQNTLVRRFSETRRRHPLSNDSLTLTEAITKEKTLLNPLADMAHITIDTSYLSTHQLATQVREHVHEGESKGHLQLLIQSFGFKNGIPPDVDFIFDVRCLPNPYWEKQLRSLSGLDKEVAEFLQQFSDVKLMVEDILKFLHNWIPRFKKNNRSYVTVGIGCTGGQHRSVFITEAITSKLKDFHSNIHNRHRDLDKS